MLLVGSAAAFLVVFFSLVTRFDATVREREILIVQNGIEHFSNNVSERVLNLATWDEAVKHLDKRFDAIWAEQQLGVFLADREGFDIIAVLDATDRSQFLFRRGQAGNPDDFPRLAPQTWGLVAEVRRKEARRGPVQDITRQQKAPGAVQAHSLATIEGETYVLTATLVQPDFGTELPLRARAPIIMTAMKFDSQLLHSFGERFLLERVHIHPGDNRVEGGQAHAPLMDKDGVVLATIDWFSQRPGMSILERILPAIVSLLGVFGCAALYLYSRSSRMAKGLIESEARAHRLAYSDSLTGLPNWAALEERITQVAEAAPPAGDGFAVHSIVIGRAGEISDTFGRSAGEELILQAARRLSRVCLADPEPGGSLLARVTPDEFVVLQSPASRAQTEILASRLVAALGEPIELSCGSTLSGALVGVTSGRDALPFAEAVRQARLARSHASPGKDKGACFFEPSMDAALRTRVQIEAELRTALARNEMEMVYQPQVDSMGRIEGVEGLLRWRHPDLGNVAPAFFIPIAEACGLIDEIGRFTLRRAFEDSRKWPGLRLGVNISPAQLEREDFLSEVQALVTDHEVDPAQFELEITEGILVKDHASTTHRLLSLRQMGFKLALDDFGTGYSSLSYLSQYEVDRIKIDRAFVSRLGQGQESAEVISALIKLAKALDISVIAEGVETEEQWLRLMAIGCNQFQGYLFGTPLTADLLSERLAEPLAPARLPGRRLMKAA